MKWDDQEKVIMEAKRTKCFRPEGRDQAGPSAGDRSCNIRGEMII